MSTCHSGRIEHTRLTTLERITAAAVLIGLAGPVSAQTSTLTVVDNEPVDIAPGEPGPGDNEVVTVRRDGRYVVSAAFTTGQPGEIVSHRLSSDGQLEFVGRTPAGREPRAIAMARNGDYAVVVNSIDDQIAVMSIGDDGLLREVSRTGSGGDNPYHVTVAFGNIVLAVNRDSNTLSTFRLDRRGQLTGPLATESTGLTPHVVAVRRDRNGMVVVCNQGERSVSIFDVDRRGELTFNQTVTTDGLVPTKAVWRGRQIFVALDRAFPQEDLIRSYSVDRRGAVTQIGDIASGVFLTDLEANEDGLFAVTANRNDPADPIDDRNEIRVYRIDEGNLVLDASVQTEGFPPSFKQVATAPARQPNDRHVIVSEFQSGYVRSLLYDLVRPRNRGIAWDGGGTERLPILPR